MDLVCGFFLQVTPLPTGNSGFCCFEVRLLYSDQQRAEQVVELADSLVQLITVFRDQPFKKIIIFNKGTGEKLNVALLYFWGGGFSCQTVFGESDRLCHEQLNHSELQYCIFIHIMRTWQKHLFFSEHMFTRTHD